MQTLLSRQFEEQQAFERGRRFLRQLEISFGDNPSHYQRIIKALQTGPDLSLASIHEVQVQQLVNYNYKRVAASGPGPGSGSPYVGLLKLL